MAEKTASLTEDEWKIVAAGLGELPFKMSAPVFAKLQRQLEAPPPVEAAPAA